MKFKGLKLSDVALSSDELSLVKGGVTVIKVSSSLLNLSEDLKLGTGKKIPVPQKPMPNDKSRWGEDWGENF